MTFEKLCRSKASCFVVVVLIYESNHELIDIAPIVEGAETLENLLDVIQLILRMHALVLEVPKSLTPHRPFDHPITVVDESKPINVPSYPYAYFQNGEIER